MPWWVCCDFGGIEVHVIWKKGAVESVPVRHDGIKCLTCGCLLARKSECVKHKGHDVVYIDKAVTK